MPVCKKCGKQFSYRIIVDGVTHNLHGRRHCLLCAPFGAGDRQHLWSNKFGDRVCPRCGRGYSPKNFYNRSGSRSNRKTAYCKFCSIDLARERRREVKRLAVTYKGGKCVLCGYSKCVFALEFHHPDMSKKEFGVSQRRVFSTAVKRELDKCVLVCVNCHRELHYGGAVLPDHLCSATERKTRSYQSPRS